MSAIGGKATIREFLCSATIIIEVALPRNCSIIAQGVTGYRGAAYFRGLAIERKDFQCVGFVTSASAAARPLAGGKAAEPVACRWAGAPAHQIAIGRSAEGVRGRPCPVLSARVAGHPGAQIINSRKE